MVVRAPAAGQQPPSLCTLANWPVAARTAQQEQQGQRKQQGQLTLSEAHLCLRLQGRLCRQGEEWLLEACKQWCPWQRHQRYQRRQEQLEQHQEQQPMPPMHRQLGWKRRRRQASAKH